MKKYVITISVMIGIILILFGSYYIYSSNNSQNTVNDLKGKVDEEIAYLDEKIISIMNHFHNITYANYKIVEKEIPSESQDEKSSSSSGQGGQSSESSEEGQQSSTSNTITNMNMNYSSILVNPSKKINWDEIKKETEKMYHSWTTILIDLNTLNVNKDNLLKYNATLDTITQALEKEDEKTSLKGFADLYSLIVLYAKEYSNDIKKVSLLDTKSNILYSYALAESDKWQDMKNNIKKAQSAYSNIMNSGLQNTSNTNGVNKVYILLNEIEKSTDTKNKSIFYINYKNLMQELAIMET